VERSRRQRRVALAMLLAGSFMGALDGFIVTIAVPSIHADLGATFGQTQLIVAGYGTVFAVGLGVGGRLGDRYGHRRLFLIGMTMFVAASAACGAARGPAMLIAARLVQGLGAAATLPQVLSIIRSALPERQRSAAIGWYGATVGLGVVCGPALGGVVIAADIAGLGWRWVFLINVPLGIAVLVGSALAVPQTRDHARHDIDLAGAGLAAVGLAALVIPLTQGPGAGWPPWMVACLLVAPVLLAGFVVYEHRLGDRHPTPLLPLRLFRIPRFSMAVATVLMLNAAGAGAALLFCLSYYLQPGLGLSPLQTGLLFAPLGLGFAVGSAAAPRLFARYGRRVPATGIMLVISGFMGIIGTDAAVAAPDRPLLLVPVLLLAGTGQGLATNPLITLVMSGVRERDAGAASGAYLTTGELGNALGLATFGAVFLALVAGDPMRATPAAFSRALTWTAVAFAVAIATALLLVRRLPTADAPAGTPLSPPEP